MKDPREIETFEEYYPYYLSLHTTPGCRIMHILGQLVTLIYIGAILRIGWSESQYLLLLAFFPFVVYPFAWTGHGVFEKNKPAAFTNPLWAKRADWVMLGDTLSGKLPLFKHLDQLETS